MHWTRIIEAVDVCSATKHLMIVLGPQNGWRQSPYIFSETEFLKEKFNHLTTYIFSEGKYEYNKEDELNQSN